MTRAREILVAARAEALFNSDLPTDASLDRALLTAAIERSVRLRGGTRACAAAVAQEYGEHPEIAVPRMRWALAQVRATYTSSNNISG
jgi:hypothetical protein